MTLVGSQNRFLSANHKKSSFLISVTHNIISHLLNKKRMFAYVTSEIIFSTFWWLSSIRIHAESLPYSSQTQNYFEIRKFLWLKFTIQHLSLLTGDYLSLECLSHCTLIDICDIFTRRKIKPSCVTCIAVKRCLGSILGWCLHCISHVRLENWSFVIKETCRKLFVQQSMYWYFGKIIRRL